MTVLCNEGQFEFAGNLIISIHNKLHSNHMHERKMSSYRYGKQNAPIYSDLQLDSLLKFLCLTDQEADGSPTLNISPALLHMQYLVGCDEGTYAGLCILLAM